MGERATDAPPKSPLSGNQTPEGMKGENSLNIVRSKGHSDSNNSFVLLVNVYLAVHIGIRLPRPQVRYDIGPPSWNVMIGQVERISKRAVGCLGDGTDSTMISRLDSPQFNESNQLE